MDETRAATLASGAEIVTVAIRRTNIGQNENEPNLLDVIPPDQYTLLPNTASCYTAVKIKGIKPSSSSMILSFND